MTPIADTTPPVYGGRDPLYPVPRLSQRLFRHYKNRAAGKNVYKLVDGTYTATQPYNADLVATTYYGGHIYDLSSSEISALAAAGFPSAV